MSDPAPPATQLSHGMGKELEVPAWPRLTETDVASILTRFPDAGELGALLWHSPRPFSATSLIETSTGAYFLKRHHRDLRTVETLESEHAFIAHLRSKDLSVPKVLHTHENRSAFTEHTWTFELHCRSAGLDLYRDVQSWMPFLEPVHAYEAGVTLAQLHKAAHDYAAPERQGQPLISTMSILRAADPLQAFQSYQQSHPAVAAYLADKPWQQDFSALLHSLGQGLPTRIAAQQSLWTHNDWHPSNLLWSPEGQVASIFDFGLSTRTCAIHDLATAIERTAFPWLDAAPNSPCGAGDTDTALALIAGYRSVLPLSSEDMATLVQLLPLVHIEFALSEVDYFYGLLSDRAQADLAWYGYFIGHCEWFQSAIGRDFLEALKAGALA